MGFPPMHRGLIDPESQPEGFLAFAEAFAGSPDLFVRDHAQSMHNALAESIPNAFIRNA
jgi:hypothetical protein